MPCGTVRTFPTTPDEAIASRLGVRANSSEVRPPLSGKGQPAAPSTIKIQYFILVILFYQILHSPTLEFDNPESFIKALLSLRALRQLAQDKLREAIRPPQQSTDCFGPYLAGPRNDN
jgi:hypothetical protein